MRDEEQIQTTPDGQPNADQPDILLILTDQWNSRMLGCAGDRIVQTPHLDSLANQGLRFDNAYTASPVCMAARCSLVSGLFPHQHGFWNNYTEQKFPSHLATLFRQLQTAGYTTAQIGKYHFFNLEAGEDYGPYRQYYAEIGLDWPQELPTPFMGPYLQNEYTRFLAAQGVLKDYIDDIAYRFTHFEQGAGDHGVVRPSPLTPDEHIDGYVSRQAVSYLDSCPRDQPVFLCVSFPGPHTPYDAPEPYASLYDPTDMELSPNVPRGRDQRIGPQKIREMQANYFGKLTHLDERVGELLQALQKRGRSDNLLVIFAADHGEYLGSHSRFGKGNFHEESARIPMILRWPGKFRSGQDSQALVSWLDIYATIVQAARGEQAQLQFGKSLEPLGQDSEFALHEAVFSEIGNPHGFNYMVRQGSYKWFTFNGKESLFDLSVDPYELEDLAEASEHRKTRMDMKECLLDFLMNSHVNKAAGYKPLFQRIGLQTSGQTDAFSYLSEQFYRIHGL